MPSSRYPDWADQLDGCKCQTEHVKIPHVCEDPACPGNLSRQREELLDDIMVVNKRLEGTCLTPIEQAFMDRYAAIQKGEEGK